MDNTSPSFAKRVAGVLWLAVWISVLAFLLQLWSRLGGCVDERVRWWARLGLLAGPVLGYAAGAWARDLAGWGGGRSHASLLRVFWIPPAILCALALVKLSLAGMHDEARALLGTFAGYWAGFDAAIAAWPLTCGRPWRFLRDIPPEDPLESTDERSGGDGWI